MPGNTTIVGDLRRRSNAPRGRDGARRRRRHGRVHGARAGQGTAVDQRADIYAFGLIIYDMLAGRTPRRAGRQRDRRAAGADGAAAAAASKRSSRRFPRRSTQLVSRCLEPDPAKRYQTTAGAGRRRSIGSTTTASRSRSGASSACRLFARGATLLGRAARRHLVVRARTGRAGATRSGVGADRRLPEQHRRPDVRSARWSRSLKLALEGAGFISAYDRAGIGAASACGRPRQLDEAGGAGDRGQAGRGRGALGFARAAQGNGYTMSVKAAQAVTGDVITDATRRRASSKDQVLAVATKLATDGPQGARRRHVGLGSDASRWTRCRPRRWTSVRDYAAAHGGDRPTAGSRRRGRALPRPSSCDPKFGIGYQALAIASRNLGQAAGSREVHQGSARHLDGMTERERYRTRGMFYLVTGDYQQCVKEYGELIARYAGRRVRAQQSGAVLDAAAQTCREPLERDAAGRQDPAQARALPGQSGAVRRLRGDFQAAEQEARAIAGAGRRSACWPWPSPSSARASCRRRRETYQADWQTIDAQGASYAASGLGDLAAVRRPVFGRGADFRAGRGGGLAAKEPDRAAAKFAALAYAHLLRGQTARGGRGRREGADEQQDREDPIPGGARVRRGGRDRQGAERSPRALAAELQAEPQAYAKIIEGEIALKSGRRRDRRSRC